MKLIEELGLFGRAYKATRREIWVSVKVLALVTVLFALAMFFAERLKNPNYSFWDGLVWTFVKYVEDPADISEAPETVLGKIVGTLVGVLGIAIFAVPAGLIGSGLMDAMEEKKREKELNEVRSRILKAFRRVPSSDLHGFFFAPRKVSIAKLEVQGIKKDDIIDAVNEFPEFRLKNMATAISSEEQPEDRLVVEHYPLNTDYGCKIDRKSKITIVATNSNTEVGIGWFAYYLAKLGGFNYISKELEVDSDEPDSFYAMSANIMVNGLTKEELEKDRKANAEELKKWEVKKNRRDQFLEDLKNMCEGEDRWCIMLLSAIKNKNNQDDFHFSHAKNNGEDSTVVDMDTYQQLFEAFQFKMKEEFQLSAVQTTRYPLLASNLGYKLQKEGCNVNAFTIRISTKLVCFDGGVNLVLYRMAEVFNEQLHGQGMVSTDREDFKKRSLGFGIRNK